MAVPSDFRTLLKRVSVDFKEKNVTFMAAGLAYNAFVSLVPILLLVFLILNVLGGGIERRVVETANTRLPGPIADVVQQAFESDASAGASVLGVVVLLWGSLKIFRGLDTAFSEIYETESDNSFVDKLRDGLVVFVALVAAIVATIGANAFFSIYLDVIPYIGLLTPLILVGGLVLAFLPMYYVFPDVDVGVRDVLPGAVVAAGGWAVFQGVFQVYLAFRDPGAGAFFGGVIVVVTYLYASALVLLLGAVVNAVTGDHSSGRPGGVGQGAAAHERRREDYLDRDELDAYLRGLDEHLTARYDLARQESPADEDRPRPDGDVRLVEYASGEGDEREWTVELSWSSDEGPPRRPSGPTSDD